MTARRTASKQTSRGKERRRKRHSGAQRRCPLQPRARLPCIHRSSSFRSQKTPPQKSLRRRKQPCHMFGLDPVQDINDSPVTRFPRTWRRSSPPCPPSVYPHVGGTAPHQEQQAMLDRHRLDTSADMICSTSLYDSSSFWCTTLKKSVVSTTFKRKDEQTTS